MKVIEQATVTFGHWTFDSQLSALSSGLWTLDSGLWTLDYSLSQASNVCEAVGADFLGGNSILETRVNLATYSIVLFNATGEAVASSFTQ